MVGWGSISDLAGQATRYVTSGEMVDDMKKDLQNAGQQVNNMVTGSVTSDRPQELTPGSGAVKVTELNAIAALKPKGIWDLWKTERTSPVHEMQTVAALAHSKTHSWSIGNLSEAGLTDIGEHVRGAIWNDDPVCHLFNDSAVSNFDRKEGLAVSYGADYAGVTMAFSMTKAALTGAASFDSQKAAAGLIKAATASLTRRTHEGDMQFLHCMAEKSRETAHETIQKVLCWCEAMYKSAIGQYDESRQLGSINLPWFTQNTTPSATDTVRTLFAGNTPSYPKLDVSKRALGSIFHIIQDSFAAGHCRRNPPFEGPIEQCHTFTGEDHEKHADLDHSTKRMEDVKVNDLDSFNKWEGVRPGIDACIKLADFCGEKKAWDDGVRTFLGDEVFAISPNAKAADSSI